jgi:hypothetical protein
MRDFCDANSYKISYLGFDATHADTSAAAATRGPIDLYTELTTRQVIDVSSFVHTRSRLVPDLFEQIRHAKSMSRQALDSFTNFDVINLDICGCVVSNSAHTATDVLEAIAELLRWQSTRRITPWLFFLTTFASAKEINLNGCRELAVALIENARKCVGFEDEVKAKAGLTSEEILAIFDGQREVPPQDTFLRIFALVVGKWLAARLQLPTPPALVSMLPSYCMRHEGHSDPHLLSLAYLVDPQPSAGAEGIGVQAPSADDASQAEAYCRSALRMVKKSFDVRDLDKMLEADPALKKQMADDTGDLLVECGFDKAEVDAFLAPYR